MCGRFVSSSPPDEIARYFAVQDVTEEVLEPNFNVAPTTDVYVVYESHQTRRLDSFRWGLVPYWADDLAIGNRMINARAEGIADKGAFRHAFRRRRCLVPADGFYEWAPRAGRKQKQPMFVHRPDGEPLAMAGLWERWRGPDQRDEDVLLTCTIVTTAANEVVAPAHDRMPVILPPSAWDTWLDRDNEDLDALEALLVPAPASLLAMRPVGTAVNDVKVNDPSLLDPADPTVEPSGQGTLL
jgi:putative SOS response-associated peptidase YedK